MTIIRPKNIIPDLGKFSIKAGLIASSDIDQFGPCLVLQFMMDQEIFPESFSAILCCLSGLILSITELKDGKLV